MNKKEIAFIICKNSPLWYEECVRYIHDLYVPESYSIDILSIEDAGSMSAAYNAAMVSSKAKYKVYLHQDVFILNRNFIADVLDIFQRDSSVGVIGMVGCRKLPADTRDHDAWDAGRILVYDGMNVQDLDLRKYQNEEDCVCVDDVDDFLMVTQYDYGWREDLSGGQRFCDIPHSLEIYKHGKKAVIPWQTAPWCYHDCRIRNRDDSSNEKTLNDIAASLKKEVESGACDVIWAIADKIRGLQNKEIREIINLAEIYVLEKASRQGVSSEWWKRCDWSEIYEYYNWIRFVLMRIGYQREDERIYILKEMIASKRVHWDAVLSLAGHSAVPVDHVYHCLAEKKKEDPLVSVVLPIYNGADFVGETMESILGQTYKNIELIIVDDASTDHSREVIRSYSDSRIKTIFREKNGNIVYSGNAGFKAAKGKYVALIGHDDLWKPDKLEKQIAFLEEHPSYCVCFSWLDVIDEKQKIIEDSFLCRCFERTNRTADAWVRKLFMKGNCFCAPSACIRKTALDKAGYYRYPLVQLQDYDLWLRLFLEGEVYIYPEKLTYYRRFSDGSNLSAVNKETQIRSMHEGQYVRSSYIDDLSKERFVRIFSESARDAGTYEEKEILCDKAILLLERVGRLARYRLAGLLEDEECRRILEEKYGFDLNSFYKLNAEETHF